MLPISISLRRVMTSCQIALYRITADKLSNCVVVKLPRPHARDARLHGLYIVLVLKGWASKGPSFSVLSLPQLFKVTEKMKPAEEQENELKAFFSGKGLSIYSHSGILQTLANFENGRMFVQFPLPLAIIAIFLFYVPPLYKCILPYFLRNVLFGLTAICRQSPTTGSFSTRTIARSRRSRAHLLGIAREIPTSLYWRWPCPRIRRQAARGKLEIAIVGLGRLWSLQPRGLTVN